MKRIRTREAELDLLFAIFDKLEPILIRPDIEGGKEKKSGDVMRECGLHANVWSPLKKHTQKLKPCRTHITQILARKHLTAYLLDGAIKLYPSNPKFTRLLESWKDEKDVAFFRYYYSESHLPSYRTDSRQKEGLRQAILAINYQSTETFLYFLKHKEERALNLTDGKFQIPDPELFQDLKDNIDNWVVARYRGNIQAAGKHLYLNSEQRVDSKKGRKEQKMNSHCGLAVFRTPFQDFRLKGTMVGNFASVGPASGICVVEKILLKKVSLKAFPLEAIFHLELKDHLRHLLAGREFSYGMNKHLYKPLEHEKMITRLAPFVRSYECHLLNNREGEETVRKGLFHLTKDGSASLNLRGEKELLGQVISVSEPHSNEHKQDGTSTEVTISCKLDYSSQYDHFTMLVLLRATNTGELNSIKGIYSGLYPDLHPRSGKILLSPLDSEESNISTTPLRNGISFTELAEEKPELASFFGGFDDDLSDRPYDIAPFLMERALYQRAHFEGQRKCKAYHGCYLLYYPGSEQGEFYRKVLYIEGPHNSASWYDDYDESFYECFVGSAAVIDKCLSIRFNQRLREFSKRKGKSYDPADRQLVFYIGGVAKEPKKGDVITGKIHRQNRKHEPVMSDAFIVKMPDQEDKQVFIAQMRAINKENLAEGSDLDVEISQLFRWENKSD